MYNKLYDIIILKLSTTTIIISIGLFVIQKIYLYSILYNIHRYLYINLDFHACVWITTITTLLYESL